MNFHSCLSLLLLCQMCFGRNQPDETSNPPQHKRDSNSICPNKLSQRVDCKVNESLYVAPGYCAAYDTSQKQVIVAPCPYIFPQQMIHNNRLRLPANAALLNASLCDSLRRSVGPTLCGRCQNGTGPAIYSVGSQCTECHLLHILWYILLQYLPMTLFFMTIFTLRVNITSFPTVAYILYCILVPFFIKINVGLNFTCFQYVPILKILFKVQLTICSFWSLDFFRFVAPPLCASEHLTEMHVLLLEVLETLYPIILIMLAATLTKLHRRDCRLIRTLWKPFHRLFICLVRAWNPDGAVIHACATFFFLSFTKLLAISLQMAEASPVYNQTGHIVKYIVYADPTMTFNSRDHIPYLALSITFALLTVLPPALLTFYPTRLFRMCLCNRPNCKSALKSFVDTFYSSYRDGTDGGWDYRPLSGVILLSVSVLSWLHIVCFAYGVNPTKTNHAMCAAFVLGLVAFAVLKPYRKWNENATAIGILGLYACMANFFRQQNVTYTYLHVVLLITFLPHIIFLGCIASKMFTFLVHLSQAYNLLK